VKGGRLVGRARSIAGTAVLLLLLVPASDLLPLTRWNWHLWGRLREAGRQAPDTATDQFYQRLAAYLPARGTVGFMSTDPLQSADVARVFGFLQYSLSPRQIIGSADCPVVIFYSPGSADPAILHEHQFALVSAPGNGLFVLRRTGR
jgi:hypothetical protein